MALQKAEEVQADIVIGTDPDADRLGIAVRNHKGEMELLNGNQTMIVMTQFILDGLSESKIRTTLLGQRSFLPDDVSVGVALQCRL